MESTQRNIVLALQGRVSRELEALEGTVVSVLHAHINVTALDAPPANVNALAVERALQRAQLCAVASSEGAFANGQERISRLLKQARSELCVALERESTAQAIEAKKREEYLRRKEATERELIVVAADERTSLAFRRAATMQSEAQRVQNDKLTELLELEQREATEKLARAASATSASEYACSALRRKNAALEAKLAAREASLAELLLENRPSSTRSRRHRRQSQSQSRSASPHQSRPGTATFGEEEEEENDFLEGDELKELLSSHAAAIGKLQLSLDLSLVRAGKVAKVVRKHEASIRSLHERLCEARKAADMWKGKYKMEKLRTSDARAAQFAQAHAARTDGKKNASFAVRQAQRVASLEHDVATLESQRTRLASLLKRERTRTAAAEVSAADLKCAVSVSDRARKEIDARLSEMILRVLQLTDALLHGPSALGCLVDQLRRGNEEVADRIECGAVLTDAEVLSGTWSPQAKLVEQPPEKTSTGKGTPPPPTGKTSAAASSASSSQFAIVDMDANTEACVNKYVPLLRQKHMQPLLDALTKELRFQLAGKAMRTIEADLRVRSVERFTATVVQEVNEKVNDAVSLALAQWRLREEWSDTEWAERCATLENEVRRANQKDGVSVKSQRRMQRRAMDQISTMQGEMDVLALAAREKDGLLSRLVEQYRLVIGKLNESKFEEQRLKDELLEQRVAFQAELAGKKARRASHSKIRRGSTTLRRRTTASIARNEGAKLSSVFIYFIG